MHNVIHAALLQIHKPNNDQLFLGRLDKQIVGQETKEWAADWIMAHNGSRGKALFEVLWKAGDKTWMTAEQAKDLHLLDAYLELIGMEDLANLPTGTETPPTDDPQVFLGNLKLMDYLGEDPLAMMALFSIHCPFHSTFFILFSSNLSFLGSPRIYHGGAHGSKGPHLCKAHAAPTPFIP
ncbi:hypothetical protein J132_05719 [Termitomyces sp. J132]|nr:hypothetical protein J132_05719 [Termitomyces sp. J132]